MRSDRTVRTVTCRVASLVAVLAAVGILLSVSPSALALYPQAGEESAELQEFLDRMRSFSRRGIFGRGNVDRHVRNAAGQIIELRLDNVQLRPGDAQLIAGLSQLQKLDLRESNVSDEDVRALESLGELRELSLERTNISGIAIASVGRMLELRQLDLTRTQISDQDLKHLQNLPHLVYLQLDRTAIGDAGMQVIGRMTQLKRLSLGDTKVGDAGVRYLRRLPMLTAVTLNETNVTEAGLREVAAIPGFAWIAAPDRTANEFVQRIELGQFAAAREMYVSGPMIAERGTYRLLALTPIEQSASDRKRDRQRFKIQLHWVDKAKNTDELLALTIAVDRGAVSILEASIETDR